VSADSSLSGQSDLGRSWRYFCKWFRTLG